MLPELPPSENRSKMCESAEQNENGPEEYSYRT